MNRINTLLLAGALSASANVWAEDAACATVKLGDPGWSDIAVTNGIASFLLEGLGYQTQSQTLAVPIIYAGLQKGQLDVFLGNWMPAQQSNYDKFVSRVKSSNWWKTSAAPSTPWPCPPTPMKPG